MSVEFTTLPCVKIPAHDNPNSPYDENPKVTKINKNVPKVGDFVFYYNGSKVVRPNGMDITSGFAFALYTLNAYIRIRCDRYNKLFKLQNAVDYNSIKGGFDKIIKHYGKNDAAEDDKLLLTHFENSMNIDMAHHIPELLKRMYTFAGVCEKDGAGIHSQSSTGYTYDTANYHVTSMTRGITSAKVPVTTLTMGDTVSLVIRTVDNYPLFAFVKKTTVGDVIIHKKAFTFVDPKEISSFTPEQCEEHQGCRPVTIGRTVDNASVNGFVDISKSKQFFSNKQFRKKIYIDI